MADRLLVVDASVIVRALLVPDGLEPLKRFVLQAPTLLWSEVGSALSQLRYRSEVSPEGVDIALSRLAKARITAHPSASLIADAIVLARRLGWVKTYDAEYAVLARSLPAPLMTLDKRLAKSLAATVDLLDAATILLSE